MAVLVGMSDDVKGTTFTIEEDETVIGRAPENAVPVNDPSVSGRHCVILREGARFTLKDLGSTNGTRVNGHTVQEAKLHPKDLLQIGSVEFLIDGQDIEGAEDDGGTSVEVTPGPAAAPDSFASVSPFGARQRDAKGRWIVILALLGLLALAAVGLFLYQLLTHA